MSCDGAAVQRETLRGFEVNVTLKQLQKCIQIEFMNNYNSPWIWNAAEYRSWFKHMSILLLLPDSFHVIFHVACATIMLIVLKQSLNTWQMEVCVTLWVNVGSLQRFLKWRTFPLYPLHSGRNKSFTVEDAGCGIQPPHSYTMHIFHIKGY